MLKLNLDDLDANGKKGDWCFTNNNVLCFIRYGDNLEDTCCVGIQDSMSTMPGTITRWQWNGDTEFPTFHPSIRVYTSDKTLWHGYLRNGKLEEV